MTVLLKMFLPLYAIAFVLVVFFLRIAIVSKRTGLNARNLLGRQDGINGVIGRNFKVLPLFSALVILVFVASGYEFLGPIAWLEHNALIVIGIFLLVTTLFWIWLSQRQMGQAWRIGIDTENKNELVSQGVFTLTRNPIFLGIKLNALGFFLVLPNAVTLAILLVGSLLIDIQVRLEEDYLTEQYGDAYKNYCDRVKRWIQV